MATYNKKNIEDVEVAGKTVIVRCDFNVPMKDGVITSDKRIVEALPTIKYLLSNGAKVILCSHMGKPHNIFTEGFGLTKKEKKAVEKLPEAEQAAAKAAYLEKAAGDKKKLTLKPVCDRINELLGQAKVTLPSRSSLSLSATGFNVNFFLSSRALAKNSAFAAACSSAGRASTFCFSFLVREKPSVKIA